MNLLQFCAGSGSASIEGSKERSSWRPFSLRGRLGPPRSSGAKVSISYVSLVRPRVPNLPAVVESSYQVRCGVGVELRHVCTIECRDTEYWLTSGHCIPEADQGSEATLPSAQAASPKCPPTGTLTSACHRGWPRAAGTSST